tara:strand:- start:331 stop:588 length:258 start_codon:yes stop_codon:yes gene_type:complete
MVHLLDIGLRRRTMWANNNLIAKGYSPLDGITPIYLWSCGNYKYEIEVYKNKYHSESKVFDSSYNKALDLFKEFVGDSFEYVALL